MRLFVCFLGIPLLVAGAACVTVAEPSNVADVVGAPIADGVRAHVAERDSCWSEPPEFEGYDTCSEVIDDLGLECEVANDFIVEDFTAIQLARWWGRYHGVAGDPMLDSFNLRFYADANCLPGDLLCEYIIPHNCHETIAYDGGTWSSIVYEYYADAADGVCCEVTGGMRYWFVAQAGDHPFPPAWGRLSTFSITGCESAFRSAFFGYPDWVPVNEPLGLPSDFSQTFECSSCDPTPMTVASWGAIKGLYR
jgi:hypothetical protein